MNKKDKTNIVKGSKIYMNSVYKEKKIDDDWVLIYLGKYENNIG